LNRYRKSQSQIPKTLTRLQTNPPRSKRLANLRRRPSLQGWKTKKQRSRQPTDLSDVPSSLQGLRFPSAAEKGTLPPHHVWRGSYESTRPHQDSGPDPIRSGPVIHGNSRLP